MADIKTVPIELLIFVLCKFIHEIVNAPMFAYSRPPDNPDMTYFQYSSGVTDIIKRMIYFYYEIQFAYSDNKQPIVIVCVFLTIVIFIRIHCAATLGNYYYYGVTIYNDHMIITDGIYEFIDHPEYYAQFLANVMYRFLIMDSTMQFIIGCHEFDVTRSKCNLETSLLNTMAARQEADREE